MARIPRKKKKQIPVGLYCYTATSGFKKFKDGTWGYSIKPCPFYAYKGDSIFGHCRLINDGVMDQCKSCGLKFGKL